MLINVVISTQPWRGITVTTMSGRNVNLLHVELYIVDRWEPTGNGFGCTAFPYLGAYIQSNLQ